MGEYRTVAFISTVIFLYWLVMGPLGGAQYFLDDDVGITEQDLKVTPQLPQYQFNDIDLSNPDVQNNVVINDVGVTVDNASTGYGWTIYTLPNGSVLNTEVNETGLFEGTGIYLGACCFEELSGSESYTISGNGGQINITYTKDGYYLFDLSVEQPEPGLLEIAISYISSTFNYLINFTRLTAQLPFYISIPLLMMVAYIIAVIVSRIGNPVT